MGYQSALEEVHYHLAGYLVDKLKNRSVPTMNKVKTNRPWGLDPPSQLMLPGRG
jgi:hypothetical protein